MKYAVSMRFFSQKCFKTVMDTACSVFFLALFATTASAQQPAPPPPVDPQPPRIIDSPPAPPAPQRTPRPSVPKAPPEVAAPKATPTPTLEQSLTPELKPMPADPTQRVIENTRRLMRERQERTAREQRTGKPEAEPGRVVVEGAAPVTPDVSASERITEILNPPSGVTSEVLPGGLGRRECVAQCVGPACCVIVETVPQQHKQTPLK